MSNFLTDLNKAPLDPNGNVFDNIFKQYEQVIVHSLITTFGLDFLIKDQMGGDVDTINSVRNGVPFKNSAHQEAYNNRGAYHSKLYHQHTNFVQTKRTARQEQQFIDDAYVPENSVYYGKASSLGGARQANLDHVVSSHEIHDDPARILAGIDGADLANSQDNLRFTNATLNKQKGDMSVEEFIAYREKSGNPLPDDVKAQMRDADSKSRKSIDNTIEKKYYLGKDFISDTLSAAGKLGVQMGLRQMVGFVFVEIWMACRQEFEKIPSKCTIKDAFKAIKTGMSIGIENVGNKYKQLFTSFGEGFLAGFSASLLTTLINTFVATSQTVVRNLRQIFASIARAGSVLLFNPNGLLLGDRIKVATVTLATGVCSVIGLSVGDLLGKSPLGMIPEIGTYVVNFASTMISGLLSCTLLILLDRSKTINTLVDKLNKKQLSGDATNLSKEFEQSLAEIKGYNVDNFTNDCGQFDSAVWAILSTDDEIEPSEALKELATKLKVEKLVDEVVPHSPVPKKKKQKAT